MTMHTSTTIITTTTSSLDHPPRFRHKPDWTRFCNIIAWMLMMLVDRPVLSTTAFSVTSFTARPRTWAPDKCCRLITKYPRYQPKHQHYVRLPQHFSSTTNDNDRPVVWKQFRQLEQAIAHSHAEDDLNQQQRRRQLEARARQRRSISQVVTRTLLPPVVASLFLTILFKCTRGSRLVTLLQRVSTVHFWTLVVASPLFATLMLRLQQQRRSNKHQELEPDDDEEPFSLMYSNTNHCTNVALCLVEQWGSVVVGVAVLGLLSGQHLKRVTSLTFVGVVQILIRGAAAASLRQYPGLVWELNESSPRPVTWKVHLMRHVLIPALAAWWWVAWDAAILLSSLSWRSVATGYARVGGLLLLSMFRWPAPRRRSKTKSTKRNFGKWVSIAFATLAWPTYKWVTPNIGQWWSALSFVAGTWRVWWPRLFLATIATIAPIYHLIAWARLIRIQYTHDLPLTLEPNQFVKLHNQTDGNLFQWRVWLKWREPERIGAVIGRIPENLFTWFFVQSATGNEGDLVQWFSEEDILGSSGAPILDRIEYENTLFPQLMQQNDRTKWKDRAMSNMIRVHKAQETKNPNQMDDYLGFAVYKTFGVGLGFLPDDMLPENANATVTPRSLHVVAAKSAVRRAKQLDDQIRTQRQRVQNCTQPDERAQEEQLLQQLEQDVQQERALLAQKLTDLVPTTDGSFDEDLDIYHTTNNYGLNLLREQVRLRKESPSVYALLHNETKLYNETSPNYSVEYLEE